jgi:hypothetical protein
MVYLIWEEILMLALLISSKSDKNDILNAHSIYHFFNS